VESAPFFYWLTYVAIWLLPAAALYMGLRDKDRQLLDLSGVLALVTLMTNKPYLGAVRQTWDPILLGLLLIGTAFVLRRWLAGNGRHGFTASRILHSDRRGIAIVGTASSTLHGGLQPAGDADPDRHFEPGGGRSGGGGAGGSF
jgi:uncharacterized membrane protein YgcG